MPNVDDCVVPDKKLVGYLMNLDHEQGRSKAMFFLRFGFSEHDLATLRIALQRHPVDNTVSEKLETNFGRKYIVNCT